jgi:hypothetical protein
MVKRLLLGIVAVLVAALIALTIHIEVEGPYRKESLGGTGPARALVLYHPSRDAHFSDELSLAVAEGFKAAGLAVDRATLTSSTPGSAAGYAIVAIVSNTYYWTPDLPTLRYLKRARFTDVPAIGLIGGLGATGRSQRLLDAALRRAGARVLSTRSYWILRPNDEARMHEPNRGVAADLARRNAMESVTALTGAATPR